MTSTNTKKTDIISRINFIESEWKKRKHLNRAVRREPSYYNSRKWLWWAGPILVDIAKLRDVIREAIKAGEVIPYGVTESINKIEKELRKGEALLNMNPDE